MAKQIFEILLKLIEENLRGAYLEGKRFSKKEEKNGK